MDDKDWKDDWRLGEFGAVERNLKVEESKEESRGGDGRETLFSLPGRMKSP